MACEAIIGVLLLTTGAVVLWYCTRFAEWQYRRYVKKTPAFLTLPLDYYRATTALGGMVLAFAGGVVVLFALRRILGLSE